MFNVSRGRIWLRLAIILIPMGAFLALSLLPFKARAFSPTGCEGDCTKCHSLNNQDLKEILQHLKIPQAEILKIQMSPIKGLWEVSIDNKGNRGLFYVDFSKQYLLPGPIVEIKSGANKTSEQLAKIQITKKVEFAKIPLNNALTMGNRLAPLKVAVFTDPDCPYCGALHREMEKVIQERKDIAFYIFLYPLAMHKDAYWKSKSIACQKSLKMLEDAFGHKEIPKTDCNSREIDDNIKLGQSLGITGTPSIIFPDGRMHSGVMPAKQIIDLLQEKK